MKSNLIQYMVVAALKVVQNISVRRSKLSFTQTLVHLHKFKATVSDSMSIFKDFFKLVKVLQRIETREWK